MTTTHLTDNIIVCELFGTIWNVTSLSTNFEFGESYSRKYLRQNIRCLAITTVN